MAPVPVVPVSIVPTRAAPTRRRLRVSALRTAATVATLCCLSLNCSGPEGLFMASPDRFAIAAEGDPGQAEGPALDPRTPNPDRGPETSSPNSPNHDSAYPTPMGFSISEAPTLYFESSVEGRELPYWVLGEGPETALLIGGIHGNERASSELAFRFLEWALAHPEALADRRLIVAPLVNPDGYARNSRENANLVDLNRNFPANNWRAAGGNSQWNHRPGPYPLSEPETRFVASLMRQYPADRVLSVHGAAACVNWDGPAESLARRVARDCGLPAKASIGYPTPGSFGSYLGLDRAIPTITLELTENREIGKPFEVYRQALMTGLFTPQPRPSKLSG